MRVGRALGSAPALFAWPARPHLCWVFCVSFCSVSRLRVSAVLWSRCAWDVGMGCAGDRWCRTRRACTSWHRVVTRARVCYISLHPYHTLDMRGSDCCRGAHTNHHRASSTSCSTSTTTSVSWSSLSAHPIKITVSSCLITPALLLQNTNRKQNSYKTARYAPLLASSLTRASDSCMRCLPLALRTLYESRENPP